jgi:hypothetical protein
MRKFKISIYSNWLSYIPNSWHIEARRLEFWCENEAEYEHGYKDVWVLPITLRSLQCTCICVAASRPMV